jgi:hypothetical protein
MVAQIIDQSAKFHFEIVAARLCVLAAYHLSLFYKPFLV